MIDLSALDEPMPVASSTKAMQLLLSDIEEDPNQPRKIFTAAAMDEMVDSIKEHGVVVPITVRPHTEKVDKWIINTGARRYRAAKLAGLLTIPATETDDNNKVKQAIENEHRDNLKPLEMTALIKELLDEGKKPAEIARLLRKDKATITHYQALIDAPECVIKICEAERTKSVQALYMLRNLYDRYPAEVSEWCESDTKINRYTIESLEHRLEKPPVPANSMENIGDLSANELIESDEGSQFMNDGGIDIGSASVTELPYHNPNIEKNIKEPSIPDPNKIKKPLMLFEYKGRAVMAMLNKRPSTQGMLWIKYEDGSGEAEVDGAKCKFNLLTESTA
jgi:ParB family chromosome partitioning protein